MQHPIPLTNGLAREFAALHGSHNKAQGFRLRARMQTRPADGGNLQHRVVIINDLHIGIGRNADTGRYYAGDDFTAEQGQQLISYLASEWIAAATGNDAGIHPTRHAVAASLKQQLWAGGAPIDLSKVAYLKGTDPYALTLCLNGDIFDFLQTAIERPDLPYPDGFTEDGRSPKNTPANAIVQLNMMARGHPEVIRTLAVHLRLGHRIDFMPGNHDRHMYNKHVWSGEVTLRDGRRIGGFTKILETELRAMGASAAEVRESMGRLRLLPFATYGDKWVEHGDMGDSHNRVRRPYGEALCATPLHEEMPMALGDFGVRAGFNAIEVADPTLDAISDPKRFVSNALHHPLKALRLVWAFITATEEDGYDKGSSREADAAQRLADIDSLVDRYPALVDQLNALRPEGEKLSRDEVVAGLQSIEARSATPFFSNFAKGTFLFKRLFQLAWRALLGRNDGRSKNEVYMDRLEAAHAAFGFNDIVCGHTHKADDTYYINHEEKVLRYVNTHTWMNKEGNWGRPTVTWGRDGKGVGIISLGVDEKGQRWSELSLNKVVGHSGALVAGDLLEEPEPKFSREVREAREIYSANKTESDKFVATEPEPQDPFVLFAMWRRTG